MEIKEYHNIRTKTCPCRPTGCPIERLRVALIGGMDRQSEHYRQVFESGGAELWFHTGQCAGSGAGNLRSLLGHVDVVVFITTINSHNALRVVKAVCRKSGKTLVAVRETGPRRILNALAEHLGGTERAPEKSIINVEIKRKTS